MTLSRYVYNSREILRRSQLSGRRAARRRGTRACQHTLCKTALSDLKCTGSTDLKCTGSSDLKIICVNSRRAAPLPQLLTLNPKAEALASVSASFVRIAYEGVALYKPYSASPGLGS
jgi:hypothetical protein